MKRWVLSIFIASLLSSGLTAAIFRFYVLPGFHPAPGAPAGPQAAPAPRDGTAKPGWSPAPTPSNSTAAPPPQAFADFSALVEAIKPAVVHIAATSGRGRIGDAGESLGTGIIVRADGLIVTNYHVIKGAARIQVRLADGKTHPAYLKGRDALTDLALLKIEATGLPVAPLGDSDAIPVGAWVVAVGNPFGLEYTTTAGIISAKNRKDIAPDASQYWSLLQTDAAINPGNSGGPLVSLRGEVIGLNTLVDTRGPGIGYAIPSNIVKEIVPHLEKYGSVERSYLGIHVQTVTPELAEQYKFPQAKGAIVVKILPDSPAEKAGLREGDIITEFNGKTIEDDNDLTWQASIAGIGKNVEMKVFRDHRFLTLAAVMAAHPANRPRLENSPGPAVSGPPFGIHVQNVATGPQSPIKVMVVAVEPDSVGERHGIRQGDIILKVGNTPVTDVKTYNNALQRYARGQSVMLLVESNATRWVILPMQ